MRIIDADAAKLAGLQIDTLSKVRTGQITLEKFYLIKTISVTVPQDYDHATCLASFREKDQKKFYGYNYNITDVNFAKVTTQLVPGKTYAVKIFGIHAGETATSEECLAVYREVKAFLVGAQGVAVAWETNHQNLPKDRWCASFDEKEKLPFSIGFRRVPGVHTGLDDGVDFHLRFFESALDDRDCLLCFCEVPVPTGME